MYFVGSPAAGLPEESILTVVEVRMLIGPAIPRPPKMRFSSNRLLPFIVFT